ncbi:hypothetical protein [Niveispirillum lacus]|uniref:hypothetical protein n=1 Tax=Niveispirillum lacus TaxID=1981099 RepID=UPI000B9667C4|nr:hypothetical protein [Niveispirillum lacus]
MAAAIHQLIAAGHPPSSVWQYTPRQIAAFAAIDARRLDLAMARSIVAARAAHHGKDDSVKKLLKELSGA